MNKIFRIVWSQATQSWVAVSELTKAHKKQSSSNAQKSAVKFSGNFIKSSAIALTLLSGSAAYAADAASGLIQINSTGTATASGSESIAVGKDSKATSDTAVAIGKDAEASGKQSVALGNKAKATGENSYAIGWGSNASHPRSISIGYNSAARHNNSLALGYNTIASGPSSVALGAGSNALGDDSYAIGYGSKTNTGANFAMAFGNSSKANKANDIAFGKEAETRDQGQGHSIAIGYGAMSGTNNAGKNLNGNDAGGVAIGTGAYTGVNQTDGRSVNSSVAVGAGAGAGFRKLDNNGMPVQNATDVDNNDEVLKKAFGVKNVADYQKIAGGTNGYTNVNINEGTALGRNARAIGDQSVAIGAQTIAGMGAIALGGNDITQFADKKYYKSTKENFAATETEDHNQDAEISKDTISGAYNRLVGTRLDKKYKATYAQDGSVVLGVQAHSSTPLGTALGTNALIRKGAFGATAIGAGSQVQANAEAAVAIGMGSFADGKYAVAAGTAARAKESAVAAGYSANAEESAVAVGDSSKAVVSSVAVGRGAKAEKVADIAVGKGAVASGEQGAIAMGLGTIAKGHSSIMIGGSDISKAASETVNYVEEDHNNITDVTVEETINGEKVKRHYKVVGTTSKSDTLAKAYEALTGKPMDTTSLDYSKVTNGHSSISLGIHALSQGNLGTAIGTGARADSLGSIALGAGAKADRQNAVAIGTGSTTELQGTRQTDVSYNAAGSIVSFDSPDVAYTFKWAGGINTSSGDVVSFGSAGAERQLKNVAAGRVAEDSTDAINGSQLNSVARKVASGWQVAGNEKAKVAGIGSDDQVNFTNGNGTTVSVTMQNEVKETVTENGKQVEKIKTPKGANIKFDVDVGKITEDTTKPGAVKGPVTADEAEKLANDLANAQNAVNNLAPDADDTTKKAAQDALKAAQDAAAPLNKVATAQNVADMINASGFTLKTSATADGKKESGNDEVITSGKAVEMVAGKNLTVKQEANGKVTYSLAPELSNLTSAEFKGTGTNAPTTKLTNAGVTITSAITGKNPISLTENGLDNGSNPITNVAGNLPDTKNNDATTGASNATKSQVAPTLGNATNQVNPTNAATVSDVLNAGWNIQGDGTAVDFVKPYDTVNFVKGDGTSVAVESADGKTSTVKYSVNLGNGLEKDANNNITVKAADESLEVTNGGVKVKSADNTLTTDANGLKVNTGNITASSVPTVTDADKDKIATVGNVAEAIKAAAWKATSDKTDNGENSGKEDQEVKAGDTVTFEADKNIKIAQAKGKFTFSTKDDVEFNSVQLGGNKGPKLTKTDGNDLKVSGSNGTDPVKITNVADGNISADSKDAINGSQFNAVANNNIKLGGDNKSETNGQSLNKAGGVKFNINGANGIETEASGDSVTVKINAETKAKIDSVDDKADKNLSNITADGETKIKNLVTWKAKASNSGNDLTENDKTEDTNAQQVGADGVLTLDAGKNLLLKRSEKTFTYALSKTLSDLTSAEFKKGDVTTKIDGDGLTIQAPTPAGGTAPKAITVNKDGISAGDKAITDVNSGLTNYGGTDAKKDLINLGTPSTSPKVPNNNAATVGDLRNMGWVVSSNKKTDDLIKEYSDTVKNANEVRFVGEGTAIVTGKTEGNVRTITVKVDDQTSTNKSVTPVSYTKKDGTKVYPKEVDNGDGTKSVKFYPNPDGSGTEIPPSEVITSVNGPKGTKTPTTLSNVEGNLDGAKTNTTAPTTSHAGVDTKNPTANNYVNTHNAATVGDVLQAGWNLQNNGTAKDFVKPYDTVNFVNGINTTAVVTTSDDGTTSNVTYNVTGLPVTYTTADGTPVSKIGDKYYKVNDKGQPVDANGKPSTKVNANGQPLDENGVVIQPIDTTTNPLTSKLVNPNVTNTTTEPNKKTTDPTQLGNVTSGLQKYGDTVDGKEVPGSTKANNGLIDLSTPTDGSKPKVSDNTAATVGDLRNMGWIVSSDKTTGETDKAYTDTVKNANEVKFVGAGTAIVSGKTVDGVRTITVKVDDQTSTNNSVTPVNYTKADGTKVYPKMVTNPDTGKEELKFFEKPDGSGAEVPKGDVITSINGLEGTTSPTTLKNVKNNIPNVNDGSKTITTPDGKEKAGDVENINKAPLTAEEAAALANPKTKDGQANLKHIGNNAATVSDVLNAGWNLQNNGAAKDFVKPFDTVNFRDGGNTTVSVTTDDNLTSHVQVNVTGLPVSNTITDPTTGKQVPVVKVGDAFYRTNPDGTPNIERDTVGNPTNGYVRANDGKLYSREDVTVTPAADPTQPPTITPKAGKTPKTVNTNLVNPNVDNTKDNPGNNVNTPNQLGNVANGAKTFTPVAADGTEATDAKPAVKLANDGKWYPADQVEPNGKPKENATPVANPLAPKNADGDVLEKGNDGKWYKAADLTNGKPNNGATVQQPVAKPANSEKSGLIDFTNSNPNNAATIGDLQNMGWVVSAEGNSYSDQVRNANEVKFIGKNGIQVSGKTDAEGVRTLTFEMEAGEVTSTEITKADGTKLVKVGDKVYKPEDIGTDGQPKQGKDPVGTIANDGKVYNNRDVTNGAPNNGANPIDGITVTLNNGSKFVTGNQVADAIEKSGFVVGKNNKALSASDFKNEDEKVNPNDELRFADGDNTNVKLATKEVLDASGKVKTVTTVKVDVVDLPVKYTDADGNIVKKGEDGKYYNPKDLEGKVYDPTTKTYKNANGTALDKQPEAKNNIVSSLVNPNDAKDGKVGTPSTLTNVASGTKTIQPAAGETVKDKDNKELALANNGKWYEKEKVGTDGKPVDGATPLTPVNPDKAGLADLDNSKSTNALSVEDAKKLGWVVGTPDNNYNDQVRNANKVDFKGGNGIEVTGKTTPDGIREITVGIKEGTVTNNVKVTKEDGTVIEAIRDKDGKLYEKDVNGKVDKTKPVETTNKDKVENNGSGFVTGNTVATAIQESGWNVGLADSSKANKAFNDDSKALSADTLEKVNPDDNVRFADGKNTKVQAATMDEVNKDGKTITNTYVRFNVDLPISQITSEDKDGNKVAKAADGKWYPVKDGKPDTTKEALEPSNVRTSASIYLNNKS